MDMSMVYRHMAYLSDVRARDRSIAQLVTSSYLIPASWPVLPKRCLLAIPLTRRNFW